MKSRAVLIDLVSGIVGNYIRKYEASGRERRYVIEYKEANTKGMMSSVKKLPSTIPPEGILEFPGVQLLDGRPWVVVISYGRDDLHPPLIKSAIDSNLGATIKKLDELSISSETKQESMDARQRIMDRNREQIVKDAMKINKEVGGGKDRDKRGFLGMNIGEE